MLYRNKVEKNNPVVFQIIKNSYLNKKLSHAFLFNAPKNVEIKDEPLFLIQTLISPNAFESLELRDINSYADLITIDGSKNLIAKEDVTNAVDALQQTPLEAIGVKILFIKNIENSNKQSLNSLLKFIEEPTKNTFIIITTNNPSQVLPTIKSRAYSINVLPLTFNQRIDEMVKSNFSFQNAKIAASIFTSPEEASVMTQGDLEKLIRKIVSIFEDAIENKRKITYFLHELINKDNYKNVLNIFRVFFNDIAKYNSHAETIFEEHELLQKYVKFNYNKALTSINSFLVNQEYNANFDLAKINLILELEACYV